MSIFHPLLDGEMAPEDNPADSKQDTDKWGHGYIPAYDRIAKALGPNINMCELGVHSGASLYLWRDRYFPEGLIVGIDNNQKAIGTGPKRGDTRTALFDQTDPELRKWLLSLTKRWDLVVDDCSHDGELTLKSWKLLWPIVHSGGYYIIEDWIGTGPEMRKTAHFIMEQVCGDDPDVASVEYFRGTDDGLIIIQKRLPR